MITVTLLRAHTHAGIPYAAGRRLHVDAATAAWLAQHGVVQPAKPKTLKSAAPAAGEPAAAPGPTSIPSAPRIAGTDTTGDDHER